MRFAEVFLRLGCSLVAWMLLYTLTVWLAALHAIGCGPDGADMHRLLLGLAPFAAGFAFLLRVTRPFPEIHRILSWLGIPLALPAPFALYNVAKVFARTTIGASSICSSDPATAWQLLWAPVQIVAIGLIAFLIIRVSRRFPD